MYAPPSMTWRTPPQETFVELRTHSRPLEITWERCDRHVEKFNAFHVNEESEWDASTPWDAVWGVLGKAVAATVARAAEKRGVYL